jgi:hypothetical protein
MKTKLAFMGFLLTNLLIIQYSCKKEPICAGGVERPEENLPWLKTILETTFNANIYKVLFENVEYIVISDLPGPDAISVVFDCDGTRICENGGINPGGNFCSLNNAEQFWTYFEKNKTLVFECRFHPE